ncbi:hypothetical protein ACFSYB_08950 [Litchfieldia salsa]
MLSVLLNLEAAGIFEIRIRFTGYIHVCLISLVEESFLINGGIRLIQKQKHIG